MFDRLFSLSFIIFHLSFSGVAAQTSDSLILYQLKDYGIRFSADNSVTLLMSGQEKFDDMFEAIRQAKQSVHLEYFNFRNDSIAMLLFDILRKKRSEGVEVRALFDGFGNDSNNQPLKKHHLKDLWADSVNIYEFDPIRFPWVNHIWPRDHRKIVVIDGNVAYTGGMNVADYYIKGTEQVGAWRDMHCRIEGGAVDDLQRIFVSTWKKTTGEELTDPKYFRSADSVVITGLKPDTTATCKLTEQAAEARRAYKRKWARENRDKVKAQQERYWARKAAAEAREPAKTPAPAAK